MTSAICHLFILLIKLLTQCTLSIYFQQTKCVYNILKERGTNINNNKRKSNEFLTIIFQVVNRAFKQERRMWCVAHSIKFEVKKKSFFTKIAIADGQLVGLHLVKQQIDDHLRCFCRPCRHLHFWSIYCFITVHLTGHSVHKLCGDNLLRWCISSKGQIFFYSFIEKTIPMVTTSESMW